MVSLEKMSSGNADTAFVRNCDLDSNYMVHIQSSYCVVFQCINVLHSIIMETMLLWISKYQKGYLKMELLLLYVAIIIS